MWHTSYLLGCTEIHLKAGVKPVAPESGLIMHTVTYGMKITCFEFKTSQGLRWECTAGPDAESRCSPILECNGVLSGQTLCSVL